MSKLTKSLAELDAAADELLAKSKTPEKLESEEKEDELTPEDISENAAASETEDAENSEDDTDEEASETEDEEDSVKKSCCDPDDKDALTKSDDDTDEEALSDEGDDNEDEETEETPEEMEKSFKEDFQSDDSIRMGVDQSEFLSAVVDIFSKSLGDMQYDMQSQRKAQDNASQVLAKSLQTLIQSNKSMHDDNERLTRRLNKLEKSLSQSVDRIMDCLDELATQPAHMRKSMANISVHDRDFDSSLNGQKVTGGFESMSKSEVLTVLNNELYAGNQNVTPQDIISYESGAPLRRDLQLLVASKNK